VASELAALFEEPLNPVAGISQKKVRIPEGLDLDLQLNEEPPEEVEEEVEEQQEPTFTSEEKYDDNEEPSRHEVPDGDEDDVWSTQPQKEAPKKSTRQDSVYILSSNRKLTKPTVNQDEAGLNIPVVTLPQNLGPVVVGPLHHSPKKHKPKAFTVDKTEEMPEGADAVSDEEEKKKKRRGGQKGKVTEEDLLGEINLNAPLAAHEALPVQRHRTELIQEQAQKTGATKGARPVSTSGGAEPEKPRRRRPQQDGEPSQKPHRPRRPQQEGQLVDLGLGLGGEIPSDPSAITPVADDSYAEVSSPPAPENAQKPRRPRREPKEGEKKRRPREKKDEGSADLVSSAPAPAASKPQFRSLVDAEHLRIAYDIRASTSEKGKVTIFLIIENKTEEELSSVEFQLSDSLSIRTSKQNNATAVADIGARSKIPHQLSFVASNISLPQKLKGSLSYTYLGNAGKVDLLFNLPCSSFVAAVSLTKEQFASTLSGDANLVLSSSKIKPSGDFKTTVIKIKDLLHVEVVQLSANTASAYGKSVLEHHVAMLIKDRGEGVISVDLKCSDGSLGSALTQELNALFR